MTIFDTALAAIHAHPDLSLPADHRVGGQGPATRIRVIRSIETPDAVAFGQGMRGQRDTYAIRRADVPGLAAGDSLTLNPDTAPEIVKLIEPPAIDIEGLTFTVAVRRF